MTACTGRYPLALVAVRCAMRDGGHDPHPGTLTRDGTRWYACCRRCGARVELARNRPEVTLDTATGAPCAS